MRAHVSQTLSYFTMLLSRTLIISVSLVVVRAQFEPFPRNVVKTLSVDNGAEAGTWRREEFCPTGTYATGFKQKVNYHYMFMIYIEIPELEFNNI